MTPIPRVLIVSAAAFALVGVGACGSDSNKTSVEEITTVDATLPPGVVVPGVTDDCQAVYLQFITAMTSAFAPTGAVDYNQVFGDVTAAVPADLHDDLALLSGAFQEYGAILAGSNGDMTAPEVQTAIQALATPEINAASAAVQDYFETVCPGVG